MCGVNRIVGFAVVCVLLAGPVSAQGQGDVWREFAAKVDVGTELTIRLRDGQRFRATLIATRDDALMVQPKTRVPVAVQPVPYTEIVSLERRREGGMSGGKAAAIGIASGVGTFFGILLVLLATLD